MISSRTSSTRKNCDFTKLLMAGYDLELKNGNTQDFEVIFYGPKDTAYENGVWKVRVTLPDDYPFASPSIGFVNKLLHPNVDEASGSVCLDVISSTWTPLYSLVNVFEVFLPQLLSYPNPMDPLNTYAATLFIKDQNEYERKVREHVREYASKQDFRLQKPEDEDVTIIGYGANEKSSNGGSFGKFTDHQEKKDLVEEEEEEDENDKDNSAPISPKSSEEFSDYESENVDVDLDDL